MTIQTKPNGENGLTPVVVIGTSSGGTEALSILASTLPENLGACVLIVRHLSPETSASYLVQRIRSHTKLPCHEAIDGMPLTAGHIHVAPADKHLLIDPSKIWVVHGPRENRWRPAIDTLFRSAAVSHRNFCTGVVLTGSLDDGTAGLSAIKRCGGTCIVQDPDDAAFPDMPRNALMNVAVDYRVPLIEIGPVVSEVVEKLPADVQDVPQDLAVEARIARAAVSDPETMESLGERSEFTCPECGGVLWAIKGDARLRYRCHTGHGFSQEEMLAGQSTKIQETLWRALRMFEERKNILLTVTRNPGSSGALSLMERMQDTETDIQRLRSMLR